MDTPSHAVGVHDNQSCAARRELAFDSGHERVLEDTCEVASPIVPISLRFNSRLVISLNRRLC